MPKIWASVGIGASCAVLVLLALASNSRSTSMQLLGVQKAAVWNTEEEGLWKPEARMNALAQHSELKLKQIVRSLRKNHLLHGKQHKVVEARQPHFGPGKVEEVSLPSGMRVFQGRMLCAEGESSCEHPCEAFYTITGETPPEDCKCKCRPNPKDFYKDGSTICSCPDSPISPDNDFFPYKAGEKRPGLAAAAEADAPEAAPALAAGSAQTAAAGAQTAAPPVLADNAAPAGAALPAAAGGAMHAGVASLAGLPFSFMGVKEHEFALERDIDARLAAIGVQVQPLEMQMPTKMQPQQMQSQLQGALGFGSRQGQRFGSPQAPYGIPQMQGMRQSRSGLWVGAGPAFLPPDGDYPGGSTGIPMDGYLAFETGHGTQPYHGTYAPMQEAGIASRAPKTLLRQLSPTFWNSRSAALGEAAFADSHVRVAPSPAASVPNYNAESSYITSGAPRVV